MSQQGKSSIELKAAQNINGPKGSPCCAPFTETNLIRRKEAVTVHRRLKRQMAVRLVQTWIRRH